MKPLLRSSLSLRTLVLFSALLEITRAECGSSECDKAKIKTVTTTTTITFEFPPNCNLSTENDFSGHSSIVGLTPGTVYQISVQCLICCTTLTTKPEAVGNLSVTEITTSSVSLAWTEPEGNSSFYRVQWTDGENSTIVNTRDTSRDITNLTAGVQYVISVRAVAADNDTEGNNANVTVYTKPEAVRNLSVTEITTSSVSLAWTEPEGSSSFYRVQWTDGENIIIVNTRDTSRDITNLTAGVQYVISVRAVAADNDTEGENTTVTVYTKPEAVRNLSVTEITTSSVSLTWTEPEGSSSFYRVQWTDGENITIVNTRDTSRDITNLTAGVQYVISVSAVAADNDTKGDNANVTVYTKPEAVRNLNVTEITTSSVSLAWTEPEGNSSFYRVQWTDGENITIVNTRDTSRDITNLTAGVQYVISVSAVAADNDTEGDNANVTVYTKPEAVGNLNVTEITTSSVSLTWTEPEGSSSFYRVQWTDGKNIIIVNTRDTSRDITNLTAGVQYVISVSAVAADNDTEGENTTVTVYTKPEAVRNLSVTEITTSSVSLAWTEPEGNSSFYRVQWTDGENSIIVNTRDTSRDITNLTAGVQYVINVSAVAADNDTEGENTTVTVYTKPEAVRNLSVTEITTSSVSLTWTEPEGSSSFYRVQWTDGKNSTIVNTRDTSRDITNLTAGVQYVISVSAVAADNDTEGENTTVTVYTKPGKSTISSWSTNTSSIFLNWTTPTGKVFEYKVEWHNGGAPKIMATKNTFAVLSDLTPGTNYTITVFAVAGDSTTGESDTITLVTKPAVVQNLTITNVATSSVSLSWMKPEGNATLYTVTWAAENHTSSDNTTETSFIIRDLNRGFKYNIAVAAVAETLTNEGEKTFKTTFTRPEKPVNVTITARGTDNLSIQWTLPEGRVDRYVVNISNEELKYSNSRDVSVVEAHFTDLNPGRIFIITVTAEAGSFSDTSDKVSSATSPTPPGSIIITQRTNSSLHLSWATPDLLTDVPNISYQIAYHSNGCEVETKHTPDNDTELSGLFSGTSYSITVRTVGPQNLESTAVNTSAFTLPNPVLNLVASPNSTSSINVGWSYPQGAQPYYQYLVETFDSMGKYINQTVSSNSIVVPNLEPGTGYSINVTTIAATGSESTEEETFSYTQPKAVTNLTVKDVNTTFIQLTWQRQSDHKPSYSYVVKVRQDAVVLYINTTEKETFTFFSLSPGNFYTFDVVTVVAGVESTVESTSSYTKPAAVSGITVFGSTTNLSVSWTAAVGQVASYVVLLLRDNQLVGNISELSNDTLKTQFVNQKPGVLYCVVVVTISGPFQTDSSQTCNATFPNPPGPIMVESQTVDSISFTWPFPADMDPHQYNFSVSSFKGSVLIQNNSFLLDSLTSGTQYTITVVTVGVLNYESTAVTANNYTRPHPVANLTQAGITTNEVTLVWEQPESKPGYSYVVQVSNGSSPESETETVFNTTSTVRGLLSGSNYSFTVITQTADGTQAAPVTVSYFTRPDSVKHLKAETLNTTAVNLNWMKPPGYKNEYKYLIETTRCGNQNKTVTGEVAQISELTPGTNCSFCVFVMAADGIKGEAQCTPQYTEPETVQPSVSNQGSNSSILVSWTKPAGNVENYKVHLNSTSNDYKKQEVLSSDSTSVLFGNLSAGILYSAMVTTCSGPFNASSGFITNATFPNPPGPIEILMKTTKSISIRWGEAPAMKNASFQYRLTNTTSTTGKYVPATNTSYTFTSLLSGTSYIISIATVGAMGFESESVQSPNVTTRPFSVNNLTTTAKEDSITIMWDNPEQYKESYRFIVVWQSVKSNLSNTTEDMTYNINNLVPGTSYNINVITETSDGTQGDPREISNCTDASPVTNLQCEGPNKPDAEVILSWTSPKGQHSGFSIIVNNDNINKQTNTCCNYTVSNLRHYTDYSLSVVTQGCGLPSTPVQHRCRTGITNPPLPENYGSFVTVSETEMSKFSIQIDLSLLNNTNGPITHVGVLVTRNSDAVNLTEYLGKTYDQWKKEETPVYLATVTNFSMTRSGGNQLSIQVGDETIWKGYTNGPLDAGATYHYAIVLFTDLQLLQNNLVDGSKSLVSITVVFNVALKPNTAVTGIAIGVTLGIFCVFAIILIGFIIYWKRISNKEPDIHIDTIRAKVSVAVRVEDYEAYYRKQKADSNCGFAEEFEDLKLVGTAQSKSSALIPENKPKNRYNNVLPYDSSRVTLSIIHGSPYDDYINANYMPGYNSRKEFIAAQGPLPTTVNEFWRMVWEKNVQTLVMLTRCNEQGRVKCEQYWYPGTRHFENLTLTTTSDIPLEDWTIRDFSLKNVKTTETRSVRQFHFTAWPDHRVPETTELLISFRHLVREHMEQYSRHSPTVVHCSAGVGRTGTFIAIDRLIFQIERENIVDVYGIVHDLRMHRPLMVQTEDQYVFLHQCAMDIIRSRTGTNVDLIYQNTAALSIYENVEPRKGFPKNGYHNA